jgi:hypothetical protein
MPTTTFFNISATVPTSLANAGAGDDLGYLSVGVRGTTSGLCRTPDAGDNLQEASFVLRDELSVFLPGQLVANCVASSAPDQAQKSREVTKLKGLKINTLRNIKQIRNRQVESSTLSLGSTFSFQTYQVRICFGVGQGMPAYCAIFVAGRAPNADWTARRVGFVPAAGKHIFQKLMSVDVNSNATFLLPSRMSFADTTRHSVFCAEFIFTSVSFCPIVTSGSSTIMPPCLLTESVRASALNFPLPSVSPCTIRSMHNATRAVRRRSILRKCTMLIVFLCSSVGGFGPAC